MTDVTSSPNFYIGRSADVGDMLLHGQAVQRHQRRGSISNYNVKD